MRRCPYRVVVGLIIFLLAPSFLFAAAPLEMVQSKVNTVIQILKDPSLRSESSREIKREKIWMVLDGVFDFSALSLRALGINWRSMNGEEQEEFVKLFRSLLGQVYLDRIIAFSDEKIVFIKEIMLSAENAEVQSRVISGTKEIPIDYRLHQKANEWKVYDVTIEGVSLVQNYRSQFNQFLVKKTVKELLVSLREKTGVR